MSRVMSCVPSKVICGYLDPRTRNGVTVSWGSALLGAQASANTSTAGDDDSAGIGPDQSWRVLERISATDRGPRPSDGGVAGWYTGRGRYGERSRAKPYRTGRDLST